MSASANTVYSSSFDPRYSSARASLDAFAPPARVSSDRVLEAQPISTKTYITGGHSGAKSTTQYAVRPRSNTLDVDTGLGRRPSSAMAGRPSSAARPLVVAERPRSPLLKPHYTTRDDSDRYITPAASSRGHRRNYSSTEDPSRLSAMSERDRSRHDRAVYREQRHHPISNADAYSYTNAREQFDRDFGPARPSRRDSVSRRERPLSMTGMETYLPPVSTRREGPPPSSRGFDKLERVDPPRRRSRSRTSVDPRPDPAMIARDPLLLGQRPASRTRTRTPVVTHQSATSGRHPDGYASYGEEPDRHHHRRHSRHTEDYRPHHHSRDDEPEDRRHRHKDDSDHGKSLRNDLIGGALAAVGLGTVATTATKDREHDRREKDHRDRDRDRDTDRSDDSPAERERRHRERLAKSEEPREHRKERRGGSSEDDEYSDLERRRRREARNRERDQARDRERRRNEDSESGSDLRNTERRRDVRERGSDDEVERRHRDREHAARYGSMAGPIEDDAAYNPSALVPSPEDERPKKVTLVEPSVNKEPEAPPKGILKPPRDHFPEEPNPVREGVAPLKDAGKKGIPPGARWTKIDRRLVNPAALEEANERFEERPDYVIVLRVLTKEEIQKFAEKTQEIRGMSMQRFQQYFAQVIVDTDLSVA